MKVCVGLKFLFLSVWLCMVVLISMLRLWFGVIGMVIIGICILKIL